MQILGLIVLIQLYFCFCLINHNFPVSFRRKTPLNPPETAPLQLEKAIQPSTKTSKNRFPATHYALCTTAVLLLMFQRTSVCMASMALPLLCSSTTLFYCARTAQAAALKL